MGEWKTLGRAAGTGAFKTIDIEAGIGGFKELEWEGGYEDFTTFTEVDVGSDRIQKIANHVDHRAYRNETTYLYKDYGAAHFGDFTHKIKIQTNGGAQGNGSFWALSNNLGNTYWHTVNSYTLLRLTVYTNILHIAESYSGTKYQDTMNISSNTWYYVKLVKAGTSFNAYVYSDDTYTTLVDTLTLTLHANHTLRYLYACNTHNTGLAGYNCINDIENFDLG